MVILFLSICLISTVFFINKPKRMNIILIVANTLRADHLSSYGYHRNITPNLDKFANENVKFNYAFSTSSWTNPSIASLFTGKYVPAHGLVNSIRCGDKKHQSAILDNKHTTLAESLKENGYQTIGFEANDWINSCSGYNQGFDRYNEIKWNNAKKMNKHVFKAIDHIKSNSKPFFLFLHYVDPHEYQDIKIKNIPKYLQNIPDSYSPKNKLKIVKYDYAISSFDKEIGRLFDYLKTNNLYENSMIFFIADHGEHFGEHNKKNHGMSLYNEGIHIPFIVKFNGKNKINNNIISNIDIYPTILKSINVPIPDYIQGYPIFSKETEIKDRGVISETGHDVKGFNIISSYINQNKVKLIINYNPSFSNIISRDNEKNARIYDIKNDRLEKNELINPKLKSELKEKFYKIYNESIEQGKEVGLYIFE